MKRGVTFGGALRDLGDRSPELLLVGGLVNAPPTLLLWLFSDLRTWTFYAIWGAVACCLALLANFQTPKELADPAVEPRAWRTISTLQAVYVIAVRIIFAVGPTE